MKTTLVLIFLTLCITSQAAKQLSAHVHGSVGLDMAAEGKQILVMLKSPADSFLGFEYKPKTKKEKELVKKTKQTWMKNIMSLVGGDSLKDCKQGQSSWNLKYEGSHSEILAEAYINCSGNVEGREITISMKDSYKKIETIHLQLLRSDGSALNKKIKDKKYKIKL